MPKKQAKQPWTRIDAGPDTIEVRPSVSWRGVNIRVVSSDGEVSLREEEVRRLIAEITAALEASL